MRPFKTCFYYSYGFGSSYPDHDPAPSHTLQLPFTASTSFCCHFVAHRVDRADCQLPHFPHFLLLPYLLRWQPVGNMFEWHFTFLGARDSPFEGGLYHGSITLPADYPQSGPAVRLLTHNQRFKVMYSFLMMFFFFLRLILPPQMQYISD